VYSFECKTKRDGPLRVLEYHHRYRNEELIKHIPYRAGLCVLDCGCEQGVLLDQLYGRTWAAWGVDRSVARLEDSLAPGQVSAATSIRLPFGDNVFDVLLGQGVVVRDSDLLHILSEFARVLRPGGRLILWERRRALSNGTMQGLDQVMSRAGLDCTTEEPFDWLAFPTAVLLNAVPPLATSFFAELFLKIMFAIDGMLARAPVLQQESQHVIVVAIKRNDL
jgi:SAM-dependent methyltransferase